MNNLLLKARRILSGKVTGPGCALFFTVTLTVLAVAVTSPVPAAFGQSTTTATAKKTPTPKPTPRHTPTPTPKRTPTPKPKLCTVCYHNKDKRIPCSQVDEFLENHPGATRGRCHVTGVQNR